MKKVGVIGTGDVGTTLADGFAKHGWSVMRGTREPKKLDAWKKTAGKDASVGTVAQAAAFGDLVVLAVKGTAAESAVALAGPGLAGKAVIDTTNPIADAPPVDGVLRYFTTLDESLMERLQKVSPKAKFVKAFSCVGASLMVDPKLPGGKPTMFVCGSDAGAKAQVFDVLASFGWEWDDLGAAAAARAIEPLAMLWCIPGFLKDDWSHAFKMLRP